MIPIQDLLNRIRWDADFARGEFALGYYDRVAERVIYVSFRELSFPEAAPHTFQLVDADGQSHRVPFHRVRVVMRDGCCIWQRPRGPK